MANVLLTTRCNLHCAYCFAQERLQENRNQVMTLADAAKVIGFLKRSGHPIFRAMGGEPTLHPGFPAILQMALEQDMRVDVLSNATWPDSYNALFRRVSPRRLLFLLNIDHPDSYSPHVWRRIQNNLEAVAGRGTVTLSFNIFEKQPRYEYLLDLIRAHGINKLRMSFSLPVVGVHNACLSLDDLKEMGSFVVDFVHQVEALGVNAQLDNAFPLCIFNHEQAGELLTKGVFDLQRNARCGPIIDIGPDLSVWCCFCLSHLWNRHLDEFENLQAIEDFYKQAMSAYQGRLFPLDECHQCRYREVWGCQGGCLSYTILKHGDMAYGTEPAGADGWRDDAILALSPGVEIERYDLPVESFAVRHKGSRVEMEVDASLHTLLEMLDGTRPAGQVIERFAERGIDPKIDGPVAEFAARATQQAARNLLLELRRQGFIEPRTWPNSTVPAS
ncbi:MAG: radical SAM protein [Acidobacteriota bacterium]|jgi:radical SAM protein with 4Fe4S-binding SPASM domain